MKENKALIIIDVQNDFCPGGSLAIPGGDEIIPTINILSGKFERIIATQDWHPYNHMSFAVNHPGKKDFDVIDCDGIKQVLWPEHCVCGTRGAEFHSDLDVKNVNLIIRKGSNPWLDSYSAFRENDKKTITGLQGYLKSLEIKEIYLCGLALDYCVFYSAMDSRKLGFETYVIIDATKGIDSPGGSIDRALEEMRKEEIKITNSDKL